MKKRFWFFLVIILFLLFLVLSVCKKEVLPAVVTLQVHDVTSETAIGGGRVTSDGGAWVNACGICWSLNVNPTIQLSTKTLDSYGVGVFGSYMTGLTFGKTYHVRAYATNSVGTAYGEDLTFSTGLVFAPTGVSTKPISAIGSSAAISGGNVSDVGGALSMVRGICWSENTNPTIASSLVSEDWYDGTGSFTSFITNLTENKTYYARAFASNQAGISYGDQITFNTTSTVTDVEGKVYNTVNLGSQVWLMENLATTKYNDGTPIPMVPDQTQWNNLPTPGYCWFNNDRTTYSVNGALYNWHAVNTGKLCPTGWHVPADDEWTTLTTYLGRDAGEKLQKPGIMQWSDELFNKDSCLFWAVPYGIRDTIIGFETPGGCSGTIETSRWWSSTPSGAYTAWSRYWYPVVVEKVEYSKKNGFSVRCVKD